jgi:transposase-like protein
MNHLDLRCLDIVVKIVRGRSAAVKKHRAKAPKLAEWLEQNVPEGLAVFALPPSHRPRPRTINMLERLNKALKRRTRVAGLFPNEASALRLVRAVAMEISEEWDTNRKYLMMEPDLPAERPGIYRNGVALPGRSRRCPK